MNKEQEEDEETEEEYQNKEQKKTVDGIHGNLLILGRNACIDFFVVCLFFFVLFCFLFCVLCLSQIPSMYRFGELFIYAVDLYHLIKRHWAEAKVKKTNNNNKKENLDW